MNSSEGIKAHIVIEVTRTNEPPYRWVFDVTETAEVTQQFSPRKTIRVDFVGVENEVMEHE